MKPSPLILLALLAPAAHAGELKVEKKPFKSTVSLDGVFLPDRVHLLSIDPKVWADFTIKEVAGQGAVLKKGQPIVVLDTKSIDRQLSDNLDTTSLRKMTLGMAELDLANLEKTTPWRLEAAEMAYTRAKDDHGYFVETGRPLQEQSAQRSLQSAERYLESATEELNQLLKMYKEDDLTEETEEIILKRQRYAVESAEFRLKTAKLSTTRSLEVTIPRSAKDQERALNEAEVLWKTARENIPTALQQKRLEVKKLRVEDKRADEKEAELKADRAQMEVVAPEDGLLYHGEIKNGLWNPVAAAKFMKVGGKVPARVVLGTLIPSGARLQLDGFVDEVAIGRLKKGQKGYAAPVSSPRSRLAVEVVKTASHPGLDGKYHVVLKVSPAEGLQLVPGMKGKIKITTGDEGDSISIPTNSLHEEADGSYSVKLKGEGGKIISQPVTVGAESNGQITVLSGLAEGQIVVTPEAAAPKTPEKK